MGTPQSRAPYVCFWWSMYSTIYNFKKNIHIYLFLFFIFLGGGGGVCSDEYAKCLKESELMLFYGLPLVTGFPTGVVSSGLTRIWYHNAWTNIYNDNPSLRRNARFYTKWFALTDQVTGSLSIQLQDIIGYIKGFGDTILDLQAIKHSSVHSMPLHLNIRPPLNKKLFPIQWVKKGRLELFFHDFWKKFFFSQFYQYILLNEIEKQKKKSRPPDWPFFSPTRWTANYLSSKGGLRRPGTTWICGINRDFLSNGFLLHNPPPPRPPPPPRLPGLHIKGWW